MSDATHSPQQVRGAHSPSPSTEASTSRAEVDAELSATRPERDEDEGDDTNSEVDVASEDEEDEVDEVEDDDGGGGGDAGDETRAAETTLGDVTMADPRMFADESRVDGDVAATSLTAMQQRTLTEDEIEEREARLAGEIQPPDINPGSANLYSTATGDKLFRNTPIKKPDGSTILRSDLQHALLMAIFADNTRCFHNPRPAPEGSWTYPPAPGEAAATGVHEYTPVYPYGLSKGSARCSNETPEEYAEWERRWKEYHDNPYPSKEEDPEGKVPRPGARLLTFKELYMEALLNSPRCTKAVRDKVWADEEFAQDFAAVNLLINVGRMNTTLAFFAQMQTVLRSYHPLPCLQNGENSRRHMQDAPRMKSLLKSVLLPFEKASTGPGSTPASKAAQLANAAIAVPEDQQIEIAASIDEVLKRYKDGYQPSTSIVNLIFLFTQHANDLTAMHFSHPHDAHSLFFPHKDLPILAMDRARAFLWLAWHYYEGAAFLPPGNDRARENPFSDALADKAMVRARAKWDVLDEKARRKATLGGKGTMWLGLRNRKEPAAAAASVKKEEEGAGATPAATADGEDGVAAQDAAADAQAEPEDAWDVEAGERYTHRLLAPALSVTTLDEVRKENVDLHDELMWGREQARERRDFMARMAEEEAAKIASGTAEGEVSGKGKGKGKGRGTATKGKGKKSKGVAGTELDGRKKKGKGKAGAGVAATVAGAGAGKRKADGGGEEGGLDGEDDGAGEDSALLDARGGTTGSARGRGKRRKLEAGGKSDVDAELLRSLGGEGAGEEYDETYDGEGEGEGEGGDAYAGEEGEGGAGGYDGDARKAPPGTAGARIRSIHLRTQRGARALTYSDVLAGLPLSAPHAHTQRDMPSMAWDRILQRAVRGQGDACYDSDTEEAAADEVLRCGDMFRGELSRALRCVWARGARVGAREGDGGERRVVRGQDAKSGEVPYPYKRREEGVAGT